MRQTNLELCRLVTIVLVMIVHTTFQAVGMPVEPNTDSMMILTLAAFSIIGVNVFVLISGYFSAKPKWTSLANLTFICFFWWLVKMGGMLIFKQPIDKYSFFFVTQSNWFIPCYIGLLFFKPVLNKFCISSNKSMLLKTIFALLFFEIWFDFIPPYPRVPVGANHGYSVLSFLIIYLIGRYIRIHGLHDWIRKQSFWIYSSCSMFLLISAFVLLYLRHSQNIGLIYAYNNPLIIISSICFFLFFEKLGLKESKIIIHLSKSTLAVLLLHTSIHYLYTKWFKYLFENYSGITRIAYWIISIVIVFILSIVIDQLRIFIYGPLDKFLKTHIKQNEII